jgi:hypothetical protein
MPQSPSVKLKKSTKNLKKIKEKKENFSYEVD